MGNFLQNLLVERISLENHMDSIVQIKLPLKEKMVKDLAPPRFLRKFFESNQSGPK
jgi:hypothetical protein